MFGIKNILWNPSVTYTTVQNEKEKFLKLTNFRNSDPILLPLHELNTKKLRYLLTLNQLFLINFLLYWIYFNNFLRTFTSKKSHWILIYFLTEYQK